MKEKKKLTPATVLAVSPVNTGNTAELRSLDSLDEWVNKRTLAPRIRMGKRLGVTSL